MDANKCKSIFEYCEKMSMSYSYKPVLILALLQNGGRITINEAASYFLHFYSQRLERGQIAEKKNSIYSNLNCSFEQVKQNIKSNPVKALVSSSEFFLYNSEKETLEIIPSVKRTLSEGISKSLQDICYDRLDRYYSSITADSIGIALFHKPEDYNGFLSNDYKATFSIAGEKFFTMTQFMAYRKALILGEEHLGRQILSSNGTEAHWERFLKQAISSQQAWERQMQIIAYKGLLAKFVQNDNLSRKLLDTGGASIVACIPDDLLWGNGLDLVDSGACEPSAWTGENLLGYTLMQVRSALFNTRSF